MALGYTKPLYLLAFDHRGSFERDLFSASPRISDNIRARPAGVELVEARGGILLPGRWVRPGGDRLEPGHRGVHRGLIVLVTVETRRRRRALRTLVPKPVVLQ
jgi:hypothetical protein